MWQGTMRFRGGRCSSRRPRPRRLLPLRRSRIAQIQSDRDCTALYSQRRHCATKSDSVLPLRHTSNAGSKKWKHHGHTLLAKFPLLKYSLQHQVSCIFKLSRILYDFQSFEIYELTLDGSAKRILGNTERRIINEYVNDTVSLLPP